MDEKFTLSSTKRLWLSNKGAISASDLTFRETSRIVAIRSVENWLPDLAPHALRARDGAGGRSRLQRDDRIELLDRRDGSLQSAELARHVEARDRLGQDRLAHRARPRQR